MWLIWLGVIWGIINIFFWNMKKCVKNMNLNYYVFYWFGNWILVFIILYYKDKWKFVYMGVVFGK